jgi:hypothetical protein
VFLLFLQDLPAEDMKILKRSKIELEKFETHLDVLLYVLSFINGRHKRIYKRHGGPESASRKYDSRLFVTPGKYHHYPVELDAAIGKSLSLPLFWTPILLLQTLLLIGFLRTSKLMFCFSLLH